MNIIGVCRILYARVDLKNLYNKYMGFFKRGTIRYRQAVLNSSSLKSVKTVTIFKSAIQFISSASVTGLDSVNKKVIKFLRAIYRAKFKKLNIFR